VCLSSRYQLTPHLPGVHHQLFLTEARGVERAHVEDVDALHLAENLETLETGGLLDVGGDGAGAGAGADQVILRLDLCLVWGGNRQRAWPEQLPPRFSVLSMPL